METRNDDELNKLETKFEVFAPDGPFESPEPQVEEGPYYASVEEVMPELAASDPSVSGDFEDPTGKGFPVGRRDFMRLFSASAVMGATACVQRPVEKAIPYVNQDVDMIPGVPTYYATTCNECPAGCGVVVKTREGRPVKLEGGPDHPVAQGALCGVGQATLQGLYHPERLSSPQIVNGNKYNNISWEEIWERLGAVAKSTKKIGIFTRGSTGSQRGFYKKFLAKMGAPESNLYTWDSNGLFSSISEAHKIAFGSEGLPRVDLQQAKMIVGIGSDFLESGTSPVYHSKAFSQGMSYRSGADRKGSKGTFVQFESVMSLTGGKADERYTIPSGSELGTLLLLVQSLLQNEEVEGSKNVHQIAKEIIANNELALSAVKNTLGFEEKLFSDLAQKLIKEKSVVLVGGSASANEDATTLQLVAILANQLIGAYGEVLQYEKGWVNSPVSAGDLKRFMSEAKDLDLLFVIDADPTFTIPASWGIENLLKDVGTVVSVQNFPRHVDKFAKYVLPANHYLESWGDEEPVAGFISIRQPAVRALKDSRQAEEILMWIAASAQKPLGYQDYRAYLMDQWKAVYKSSGAKVDYDTFSKAIQRRGFIGKLKTRKMGTTKDFSKSVSLQVADVGLRLVAPLDFRLQDGRQSHIPVLQETGDSMTTIAWDTWAAINPNTCKKLKIVRNDVIQIDGPAGSIKVAVFPMPGVHKDTIVVPRGNGLVDARNTIANKNGVNPLAIFARAEDSLNGQPVTSGQTVKVVKTGARYRLAAMQKHNDIANRSDVYKKVGLDQLEAKKAKRAKSGKVKDLDDVPDLYPSLDKPEIYMHRATNEERKTEDGKVVPKMKIEYRWGMTVDLGKCTGCGACNVACSLENNVPQVGRDQINLGREMTWIRLDRYFDGDVDAPGVNFQPVMCQQCNHAPCEAVCPVFATTHDPEGINSMTYNRCVGTRYCANACPYKVRRFNWWTHKWGKMDERPQDRTPRALNPDVTVRTRGVMEKCNFCVGRIRDAKLDAKERSKDLGYPQLARNFKTACQQTCPADAITFGNLKDPRSPASVLRRDERAFLMLNGDHDAKHYGIKTLPNVSYLAEVTHKPQASGHGDEH